MNWVPLRGFIVDGKPDAAIKMFKEGLKIYPLAKAANPPAMEFISGSGKVFNTIHANNYEFYKELHTVIDREPIGMLDPELRGLFASIGIQKGNTLDGGKTYKLNIPKDPPAEKFWSIAVYDPQTRSLLQTSQPFPTKAGWRDEMIVNDDESIDLYIGPKAPAGKEANWIQTVPGKGWFCVLRLYSPTEAWYDKTWRPGEIELIR